VTVLIRFAAAALWLLAAGPISAQSAKSWDEVVTAAKREGVVVEYTAYVGAPTNRTIAAAFQSKYGIKIDFVEGRGNELRERIRIEQSAGRFLGDMLHHAQIATTTIQRNDNALQPHGGLPSAGRLRKGFSADELMAPVFTINYGMLVNRNLVKPGEEPKSWADLTDAKWKGKILGDDPRAPGGGRVWFVATYDTLGRGFHEKMAVQDIKWAREYRESERRVARGEFPIYFPYILSDNASLAGLPVKHLVPEEGATYGAYAVSMLRNAPHPNAARVLMEFYLSDEVQTIYARDAHGIVVDGALDNMPAEIRELANAKLLSGNDVPERMDEMFAKAKEIYK
jgi:iron(III) transport system substrate-binding protein